MLKAESAVVSVPQFHTQSLHFSSAFWSQQQPGLALPLDPLRSDPSQLKPYQTHSSGTRLRGCSVTGLAHTYTSDVLCTTAQPPSLFCPGRIRLQSACAVLLQFNNPFHLWMLWDPEVRQQRCCLARHNQMMGEKVMQFRKNPPAPHTIAGTARGCYCHST